MEILIAVAIVAAVAYFVLRKSDKSETTPAETDAPYKVDAPAVQSVVETPAPAPVQPEVVVQETAPVLAPVPTPAPEPAKAELKVVNGAKTRAKKQEAPKTPKATKAPAKPKKAASAEKASKPAVITGGRKKKSTPKTSG